MLESQSLVRVIIMYIRENRQKRYNIENGIYFITTNTYHKYPYFQEDIFCDLFVEDLEYSSKIKNFKIISYKINPDHVHLLLKIPGKTDISKIMQNIKRTVSLHINETENMYALFLDGDNKKEFNFHNVDKRLLGNNEYLSHMRLLEEISNSFYLKFPSSHNFPSFKWQKSFYDHIIRDENDFYKHIEYIENQYIKHELGVNKYCFVL